MPLASKGWAPQLYDTLTRTLKPLQPEDGKTFRMYCCGPTVYGPSHIGNFRTFILQDVLRRTLEVAGYEVMHVRNLTDIDDKTIAGAKEAGMPLKDFTQQWIVKFHEDCEKLNLLKPHQEPRATDYIPQQVEMIQKLLDNGYAYQGGDGSIYFKVSSYDQYGRLSQLDKRELKTQAITSGGAANLADEYDRDHVADFALWKAEKDDDAVVGAVWHGPKVNGEPVRGRPGWHIECSAMIDAVFEGNLPIELHGGAVDLIFPHHENEIAQSACAHGEPGNPLAKIWFHPAHLIVDGKKMSKSLGNYYTLKDYSEQFMEIDDAVRIALVSSNYRQQFNVTKNVIKTAFSALEKVSIYVQFLNKSKGEKEVQLHADSFWFQAPEKSDLFGNYQQAFNSLCDDLNISECLGEIFTVINHNKNRRFSKEQAISESKGLRKIYWTLGIKLGRFGKLRLSPGIIIRNAIVRLRALDNANYKGADIAKQAIEAEGWKLDDTKQKDGSIESKLTSPEGEIYNLPSIKIRQLAEERSKAKQAKDWVKADKLRDQIHAAGWQILDHKDDYDLEKL